MTLMVLMTLVANMPPTPPATVMTRAKPHASMPLTASVTL